ncbi:MAG: right-handed parallel beta-helix repeat-containing protein [Verrucomicrobiia bacterium]|jgi:hypothetical protein
MLAAACVFIDARAAEIKITSSIELTRAFQGASPGDRLLLRGGDYRGGVSLRGRSGTKGHPIAIVAADPDKPPVFRGGTSGMHISGCDHIELRGLHFTEARSNGLNIDDGGRRTDPATGIQLDGLRIYDVGSQGNHDGIKLSGLKDFRVVNCVVERWGGSGSGIDMVGCRTGVIEGCRFRHDGPQATSNGVQAKGGSEDVAIRKCRFENTGQRGVNLGGSTGLPYFRPAPNGFEARRISVERCVFTGGMSAVAFVGSSDCTVRFNTIRNPTKWIARILQESTASEFVPCRNGSFTDNLIVFQAERVRVAVNVGSGTNPQSFTFARNAWFASDRQDRSRPTLPVRESDGIYGVDPGPSNPQIATHHGAGARVID